MTDIAAFLNGQLDADQRAAENAMHLNILITGRHSPAFVLADIAAKRAIAALHEQYTQEARGNLPTYVYCACQTDDGMIHGEWPCDTRKHLAAPYANQPGYDGSWRMT